MPEIAETQYPAGFRAKDSQALAKLLNQHHSVVLIGMKRVGISGFLKFFIQRYRAKNQFFVYIDLNDLIELSRPAFWTLILTRLVDNIQKSTLSEPVKRRCRRLFIQSIQLKDGFFTQESIRQILVEITAAGLLPVIFVNRFDRLKPAITREFTSNLVGLYDFTHRHLVYVLTSFRPLPELPSTLFK